MDSQSPRNLKNAFLKNVKKYTFFRIFLPTMFFTFSSTVFFIVALLQKYDNQAGYYYFIYITILFIIFTLNFFIRILKREKVYIIKNRKNTQYRYISKLEYEQIIRSFDDQIKKNYKI